MISNELVQLLYHGLKRLFSKDAGKARQKSFVVVKRRSVAQPCLKNPALIGVDCMWRLRLFKYKRRARRKGALIHVILLLADESVEDGIKRFVSEEIKQAIKEIDNPRLKRSEAIHEVRKHCKKIRSVLRLVRPQFEETYWFENTWFSRYGEGACRAARRRSHNRDLR
jgi:hypothetical protein